MNSIRKRKLWLDAGIIAVSFAVLAATWYYGCPSEIIIVSAIVTFLISGLALVDLLKQTGQTEELQAMKEQAATVFTAHELVLLNEEDRPIRAWILSGKTALVIGRRNRDEEVDVDLSDCEYSSLINIQHAVINYSLDTWFIEDIGSQNGIQIKKVDDGRCYQIAPNRPCKITAGDVIYIAKTKLLFT